MAKENKSSSPKKQGVHTGAFGKELTGEYKNHIIFYDHGDKKSNDNVVACKGFCGEGEEVKQANRLADIDIMIADSERTLKILIEIEERYSSPKKIIGDIFSIAMCNQIAIKKETQEYYKITQETILIIAGVVPPTGVRKDKIDNVINKRIKVFKPKGNGLDLNKVELYFEENIKKMLIRIREKLQEVLI